MKVNNDTSVINHERIPSEDITMTDNLGIKAFEGNGDQTANAIPDDDDNNEDNVGLIN